MTRRFTALCVSDRGGPTMDKESSKRGCGGQSGELEWRCKFWIVLLRCGKNSCLPPPLTFIWSKNKDIIFSKLLQGQCISKRNQHRLRSLPGQLLGWATA